MELQSPRRRHEDENYKSDKMLMSLPVEMIENIISYLSFDQISKLRLVNKTFNVACSRALNKGFVQVQMFHNRCLKAVKSKLPRRESERKNHPLARHVDILMAVETRLSMLSMTFSKYIEANQCCFIPGKVLDEAVKVLRLVSISCKLQSQSAPSILATVLPRPHDFLQEYRDISSMAMEHFDEKILPPIRERMKKEASNLQRLRIKALHSKSVIRQSTTNLESETSQDKGECSRQQDSYINIALAVGQCAANFASSKSVFLRTIHKTKVKASKTSKQVVKLHHKIKSLSGRVSKQNDVLLKKLNIQRTMIRILKKELRETRAEMNAMHKELHSLKTELPFTKGLTHPETSLINSLTIAATSSMGPLEEDQCFSPKGYKRKRLMDEEDSDC